MKINKLMSLYLLVLLITSSILWATDKEYFENRDDFFIPSASISTKLIATPDGKKIIARLNNHTICYWDIEQGKIVKRVERKEKGSMWSMLEASTHGNKMVGTVDNGKELMVWETNSGKVVNSLSTGDYFEELAISSDGQAIATLYNNQVTLWRDHTHIKLSQKITKPISKIALSSSGDKIFEAFKDGNITIYDIKSEKVLFMLNGGKESIYQVLLSNDDNYLIIRTLKNIKIWDTTSGKLLEEFSPKNEETVDNIAISSNAQKIVYILRSKDEKSSSLILWDRKSGTTKTLLKESAYLLQSVTFDVHNKNLFVGSTNGDILMLDGDRGNIIKRFTGHKDFGYTVSLLNDNGSIFMGYNMSRVVWDINGSKVISSIADDGNTTLVPSSISKNGEIVASSSSEYSAKIWEIKSRKILLKIKRETEPEFEFYAPIQLSDDGKTALFMTEKGMNLWEKESAKVVLLHGHKSEVLSATLSTDGQTIVSSSKSSIKIWDVKSQKVIHSLKNIYNIYSGLSLSPDKNILAYINNSKIIFRDIKSDKVIKIRASTKDIFTLCFNPKEGSLASAGEDGVIKIWSTDGILQKVLQGHNGSIYGLDFSSDGKYLISIDTLGVTYLWDLTSERDTPLKEFITGKEGNWIVFDYSTSKKFFTRKDDGTFLMKKEGTSWDYMGKR